MIGDDILLQNTSLKHQIKYNNRNNTSIQKNSISFTKVETVCDGQFSNNT